MPSAKIPLQESLPPALAKVFDQAQSSIANHQKNYITLYKLHANAADYTEPDSDSDGLRLSGERMFEVVFLDMINRVLLVKKSVSVADRIVKFTAGYLKTLDEKSAYKVLYRLPFLIVT
jgi:condensin complex subunit 3